MLSRPTRYAMATACLASGLWTSATKAQDASQPDFTTGLWTRSNLLGDAGGLRSGLWNYGITFGLQDINEVWGNVTGGIKRGASYDGVTLMSVGLDTQRAFGWEGGIVQRQRLEYPRPQYQRPTTCSTCRRASGILAADTTRLWEVWYQQSFLDGQFDVKLGQQSLDQEFMTSQGSGLVHQHHDGLADGAVCRSLCRRAGLSAVVARRAAARRNSASGLTTVLGGVFQDNPPGGPFNADPQLLGSTRWGGNFNLRTGACSSRGPVRAEPAEQWRRWIMAAEAALACRAPTSLASGPTPRHFRRSVSTIPGCRLPSDSMACR